MFLLLASTIQFSNRHAPRVPPRAQRTPATPHGHRTAPQWKPPWGGGPGTQKHTHTTPGRDRPVQANDLFHTSIPTRAVEPFHAHGAHTGHEPRPELSVERR